MGAPEGSRLALPCMKTFNSFAEPVRRSKELALSLNSGRLRVGIATWGVSVAGRHLLQKDLDEEVCTYELSAPC